MAEAALKEAPAAEEERELTDGFHLIIDALKLNGVKTIYARARHSDHRLPAHVAGRGASRALVPPRAERRLCGLDRGLPDQAARHLPHGVGAGLPQRPDRARPRDHELLSDDPDLGLVRARDRRPAAGRLRGDGPARDRQAALQGGLSASCMPKISASASRARSAPRCRAVRAASISICPPNCSVR